MDLVKACLNDAETLLRLSRKTFYEAFAHLNKPENMATYMDKAFTYEKLLGELQNPESDFFFARDGEELMGYMKLNRNSAQSEFKDEHSMEIERIYVDAAFQGRSVGTRMIAHARELALQYGCKYLWLGVWENNPSAIRFYERNGFSAFSSHEFVMGDEVQIDKLMICKL